MGPYVHPFSVGATIVISRLSNYCWTRYHFLDKVGYQTKVCPAKRHSFILALSAYSSKTAPWNTFSYNRILISRIRRNFWQSFKKIVVRVRNPIVESHPDYLVGLETWETLCTSQIEASTSPPGNPPGIWIFGKFLFKFPPHRAGKLFKCPHPWEYYQITVLTFPCFLSCFWSCACKHCLLDNTYLYTININRS